MPPGRTRSILLHSLMAISLALLGACDRQPAPLPTTAPTPVFELELKPLTPLLPTRPTHLALDPLGNIYWVQETDRGDDTLFVIGEGDIPRATQLSAGNIAALLGATGGRGNIEGVASGAAGEIYFYFNGTQGRHTFSCIGQFTPKTSNIRILADTANLAAATGMGQSLPLARGAIVSGSAGVWIWVRHTDQSVFFRFDPRGLPPTGQIKLNKPFDSVMLAKKPLDMTRDEFDIASAPRGDLFLLDPLAGRLLQIDQAGVATLVRSLVGLPRELSTPTVDRAGKLLFFAASADPIPPATADEAAQPKPDVTFPAMLIFDGGKLTAINRDAIVAYPGFPVFGMHLRQLVPNPGEEAWITYDAGSGELLRAKIREKSWP